MSISLFGGGLPPSHSVVLFCPSFLLSFLSSGGMSIRLFFLGEEAESQAPGLSSFGDYLRAFFSFRFSFLWKDRKKSNKHQSRSPMGDGVLCASVILSMGPSGGGVFFFSNWRKGWLEASDFLSLGRWCSLSFVVFFLRRTGRIVNVSILQ